MIEKKVLFEECKKARELACAPYSNFKVGAVVVLKNGELIHGANIENSAYSLCICAERTAIFQAYLKGYRKNDIEAIGLIGDSKKIVTPCGSCRQVMSELLDLKTPVYMFTVDGKELVQTVEQLIPFSFDSENL